MIHEGVKEDPDVWVGIACDGSFGDPICIMVVVMRVVGRVLRGEPDIDQSLKSVGICVFADTLYRGEEWIKLTNLEDESIHSTSLGEGHLKLGCVIYVESVAHVVAELRARTLPMNAALYVGDIDREIYLFP